MSWNANTIAHACLWVVETWHHDQRNASFNEVGDWTTDFIIKAAAGDSVDMRTGKAETHAALLDEVFTSLYRATYEPDKDQKFAVSGMESVLKDKTKKMSDLADAVDSAFRFKGEV